MQAQDELGNFEVELAENEKFVASLEEQCESKKAEWAQRQKLRQEEMKEKAESTLTEALSKKMRQQHSFDVMAQSLTDAIAQLKEKLSDAKTKIATAIQEVDKNVAGLMETKKNKKAICMSIVQ